MRMATLTGKADPLSFTPERNFGAGGGTRRLVTISRGYSAEEAVGQKQVYEWARNLADDLQPARIVDLGSVAGQNLPIQFDGYGADYLQVDWTDRRQPPAAASSVGLPPFFSANLEDAGDIDHLAQALESDAPTLFILAGVIEKLHDPRWLLRWLRRALRRHPHNRLVISTLDCSLTDGRDASWLPDNPEHVRQWTLNEFGIALLGAGFHLHRIGRLEKKGSDPLQATIVAELGCSDEYYRDFLSRHHLPPPAGHLVLTTEHGQTLRTGEIGIYHKFVTEAAGLDRVIMFIGALGLPPEWRPFIESQRWLHSAILTGTDHASLPRGAGHDYVQILKATIHALFLYDTVRLVEYQDYLGIGVHVAQAKRTRLLPPSVSVMAYAHGSQFYLDHAAGEICEARDITIDLRERLSLELADFVVFASDFLKKLYLEEWRLNLPKCLLQRYPVILHEDPGAQQARSPVTTLIFYGKETSRKGYPDFCDAVAELFANPDYRDAAQQVKEVVLMGVTGPDARLAEIPGLEVEHGSIPLQGAIEMLRRYSSHSLVCLPYRADSHPLSLFEVIDSDSQLLAYAAGGIPELLPESLHDKLLCEPNPQALAAAMAKAISTSFGDRLELVRQTRANVGNDFKIHTETYRQIIAQLKSGTPLSTPAPRSGVSVIVANFNAEKRFLTDLSQGVRNSIKLPEEVIFVDDASTPEKFKLLEEAAAELAKFVPTRVIRNPVNIGLAATRNVGLAEARTPYVCLHDMDNILFNDYLDRACRILDENQDVVAVTTWTASFQDLEIWQFRPDHYYAFRPLGPDLGVGLRDNCFGDAFAVYRTEVLKRLGGWDDHSRDAWDDWQLFLRLTVHGEKILVIPQESVLYRVRKNSLLRSIKNFSGRLGLARALDTLPPNLTYSLILALAAIPPQIQAELRLRDSEREQLRIQVEQLRIEADQQRVLTEHLRLQGEQLKAQEDELGRLRSIEASSTWRATAKIRRFFASHPFLKSIIKKILWPLRYWVKD